MNERALKAVEQRASPFLESGEVVRLGFQGPGLSPSIPAFTLIGVFLGLQIVFRTLGTVGVLGDILFLLLGFLAAGLILRATRARNGLVAVTNRNVYVIRPALGERGVAKYPRGSVAVRILGSAVLGRALMVGEEKVYFPSGLGAQLIQAIATEAGAPAESGDQTALAAPSSTVVTERRAAPVGRVSPLGQPRGVGFGIVVFILTLGFYGWYWAFKTHEEVKEHTGDGVGGVIGLVIWILISPVSAFVIPSEVGKMYARDGRVPPVAGLTGLWLFPGVLLVIPGIVWFVKVQGALNRYWEEKSATA